jgi:hypothetical protein
MWPAEGSLSERALEVFADAGVSVVASDEALLGKSRRAEDPATERPPHFYAWRHEGTGVRVLFRDRALSDDWGFVYRDLPASEAMDAFLGGIKDRLAPGGDVVNVILDGENPFERFGDAGEAHLSALADKLPHSGVRLVSPAEAAEGARPLPRLATGSWIDASFDIWAGDAEDRAAWAVLARVREAVEAAELSDEARAEALEHIRAAEGSDWFWWFGPEFQAVEKPAFDLLFREHMVAALRAASVDPHDIEELSRPIHKEQGGRPERRALPLAQRPSLEAGDTIVPWSNAVAVAAESGQGSMHRGAPIVGSLAALASPEQLHARVVCRSDAERVEVTVTAGGETRRLSALARRVGDRVVATADVAWGELGIEPEGSVSLRASAAAAELKETLPPEDREALAFTRPSRLAFEA